MLGRRKKKAVSGQENPAVDNSVLDWVDEEASPLSNVGGR
jgi:hypothetical protein